MKNVIISLVICVMLLSGCAGTSLSTKTITPEQIETGYVYLSTSLKTLKTALVVAKIKFPDKTTDIEKIEVTVEKADYFVSMFKAAMDANKSTEAQTIWATVRPMVGTLLVQLAPYLVGIAVNAL